MPDMRDSLVELLKGAETKVTEKLSGKSAKPLALEEWLGIYADYLIANCVIVPPCKIGEILYLIQVDWNGKYNMQNCLVDSKITILSILRAYEEKTVVYMSTDKSNAEQKLSELNGKDCMK